MSYLPEPAWGSWMAPLVACLTITRGAVLEVGGGEWSTPFLHRFCVATGRKLVTIDEDQRYVQPYLPMCCEQHEVRAVRYDEELPRLATQPWDVVFLDQSPGDRRGRDALLFLDSAEWVVAHDYSGDEQFISFDPIITRWNYRVVFPFSPATLVLSRNAKLADHYFDHAVDEGAYMHRLRKIGQFPVGAR